MAAKQTVITIGDHMTTVSSMDKNGKVVRTLRQLVCATPPDCMQDGTLGKPEEMAAALKPVLQTYGIKARNLVFSISSTKVAFREVLLPSLKENRIQSVVEANASDYFPVDIEKYHISQKKLDEVEKEGQKRTRVMAYATPLTLLEPYFRLAELLGGKIAAIDYAGNSQYQALRGILREDASLFCYIDTAHVQMTFFREGKLLLQRSLPVGVYDYVQEYMSLSRSEDKGLLPALQEMSGKDAEETVTSRMSEDTAWEALTRLSSGIARSISYFNQSFWETPAASIIIGGPCASVYGVLESIRKETGLETQSYEEAIAGLDFAAHWGNAGLFQNNIGAVLSPLDMIPPEFQPSRKKEEREKKPSIRLGLLVLVFCAVSSLALYTMAEAAKEEAEKENKSIKDAIEELAYIEGVYETYISYQNGLQALLQIQLEAVTYNDSLADFIEELERTMPSDIIVLSMTCSPQSVVMNATLSSKTSAAAMLVQLRGFESLDRLAFPSISETSDESGAGYVSFSVTCYYKQ